MCATYQYLAYFSLPIIKDLRVLSVIWDRAVSLPVEEVVGSVRLVITKVNACVCPCPPRLTPLPPCMPPEPRGPPPLPFTQLR